MLERVEPGELFRQNGIGIEVLLIHGLILRSSVIVTSPPKCADAWVVSRPISKSAHASAHLGGDVTITDDLNVSGSTTFAGHVIAGMGLDVIDLTYLQDDLQVDGYSSFNSDVTINANLGMRGTIDLIGGTIRGDSKSKIICDGIGISAGNKESGCIISGNPNAWNIVLDQNDIQARNNGAWSILYINDYGGDVSITNSSATYSAKILSTPPPTVKAPVV